MKVRLASVVAESPARGRGGGVAAGDGDGLACGEAVDALGDGDADGAGVGAMPCAWALRADACAHTRTTAIVKKARCANRIARPVRRATVGYRSGMKKERTVCRGPLFVAMCAAAR
jgi:hypothetical protein